MTSSTAATAGIIAGLNPLEYSSSAPYTLFLFQVILVVVVAQVVNIPLTWAKQPRVIGEVVAGILLGPSVMGHAGKFTETVFPKESLPSLTVVANIGVYLLLFMVGCEVDVQFIRKNIKTALTVGIFNMAVPFGLGCAVAVGLWNQYRKNDETLDPIKFTTFMVFIAVAMCITAFPVLARILTELRLVKDRVGVIVLAAGITNDLIGWILLALSITLANSAQSLTTLYICLVTIGYCLFVIYPVRWGLRRILTRMRDVENPNGPSQLGATLILLLMLISAFFTDIIGVHPIFGAFIVGTIVPRENDYVIRLTERIEDLVNILFVPLYFALAGLSVNLGLLGDGIDWAYIICITVTAFAGKVLGGFVAARFHGFYKREALAVGVLMSCKGIVEIVVLNTGMNAGILSQKMYSMFIVMALVATFLTTPLTMLSYPQSYRDEVQARLAEKSREDAAAVDDDETPEIDTESTTSENILAPFDRLILPLTELESVSTSIVLLDHIAEPRKLPVLAINVRPLTQRTADLLQASTAVGGDGGGLNPILSILKIFCDLHSIPFASEILFSLSDEYLDTVLTNQSYASGDLLIMSVSNREYYRNPWLLSAFGQHRSSGDVHRCLYVNNNQELGAWRQTMRDDESHFSKETILDPDTLQFTSLNLVLGDSTLTRESLAALRLFFMMVGHKGIRVARAFVARDSAFVAVLEEQVELVKGSNVELLFETGEEKKSVTSFSEFVGGWYLPVSTQVSDLVILAGDGGAEMAEMFVGNNDKVVVVY